MPGNQNDQQSSEAEPIRVEYTAVVEYDEHEVEEFGLTPDTARENMRDLIARDPSFGTIEVTEGADPE